VESRSLPRRRRKTNKFSKVTSPLFEKRPRNFGIGNDIQPRRDLTRFVRWPKYIRLQRQKRVLAKRLKVPPVINQFTKTLDKQSAAQLFVLLEKYSPETRAQKKQRLLDQAKVASQAKTQEEKGKAAIAAQKPPKRVKYGLNHVTSLIESNKAKLVVIAHDVDPLELVLWLPTLCKKKGVPYVIVKGKARLGKVVHKKTAAALAIIDVDNKDQKDFSLFVNKGQELYLNRYSDNMDKKAEGGGVMGHKHYDRLAKEKRRQEKEEKKKDK